MMEEINNKKQSEILMNCSRLRWYSEDEKLWKKYDDKYLNSSDDRKSLNINYAQEPEVETCQAMLPDQVIVRVIVIIMDHGHSHCHRHGHGHSHCHHHGSWSWS